MPSASRTFVRLEEHPTWMVEDLRSLELGLLVLDHWMQLESHGPCELQSEFRTLGWTFVEWMMTTSTDFFQLECSMPDRSEQQVEGLFRS